MPMAARNAWENFRKRYDFEPSHEGFSNSYREMFGTEPPETVVQLYVEEMEFLKKAASEEQRASRLKVATTTIEVQRHISMGHRLPSYKGVCSSLHGHNVKVTATIAVEEFLDFKDVSNYLSNILEAMDHAMVLHADDNLVPLMQTIPGQRLLCLSVEPTTEAIAQLVYNELAAEYDVTAVTVNETDKYAATATKLAAKVRRVEPPPVGGSDTGDEP
jgi:6-pyruvoyl-tetrahydropterin synthase